MAKKMENHVDLETDKWLRDRMYEAMGVLQWLTVRMERPDAQDVTMYELTLTAPSKTGSDYRIRVKASDGAQKLWIAFANGSTVEEAIMGLKRVYEQRGLAWREDLPYAERVRLAEEKAQGASRG